MYNNLRDKMIISLCFSSNYRESFTYTRIDQLHGPTFIIIWKDLTPFELLLNINFSEAGHISLEAFHLPRIPRNILSKKSFTRVLGFVGKCAHE